jgi:hypothetical protein
MSNQSNYTINEVHAYEINGIPVKTGDLISNVEVIHHQLLDNIGGLSVG